MYVNIISGSHGLHAARVLSQTVTFSEISLTKTNAILGRYTDISKGRDASDEEAESGRVTRNTRSHLSSSQRRRHSSSARRVRTDRELLLDGSSTFRDFENLLAALDALEKWKGKADEGQK